MNALVKSFFEWWFDRYHSKKNRDLKAKVRILEEEKEILQLRCQGLSDIIERDRKRVEAEAAIAISRKVLAGRNSHGVDDHDIE